GGQLYVMASTGRIQQALEATEKSWKKFFPQQPFDYTFLDEEFARLYYSDRKISSLIKLFACIAIFISSLGLFGLTVFITEQRTKEIGIRKILGSSIERIVILLVKDIVKMILIAIIIASPIAWFVMNKWLQDFAYKITIHWWIFLITGAFVILIALVTVSFHTVKAAVVNPVKSLHAE
ncbi:MAG TPA: FtsX-like permease family protein, partial [Candidatus Babeliaceae bacterium]|nr:FtsX-like permease family protein [Candidatus Babeliaceae bacterium]